MRLESTNSYLVAFLLALQSDQPRFLAPLVATAQTVRVERDEASPDRPSIEGNIVEPDAGDPTSILWEGGSSSGESGIAQKETSISSRMKKRKKVFNHLAAKKDENMKFSTEHEYTFEVSQAVKLSLW